MVRVPCQMILLPLAHEVLKRGEAELAIDAVAKEVVRIGPGDIDAAEGAQALYRRGRIITVVPGGIGLKRGLWAVEKRVVDRGAARGAAIGKDGRDHVWILRRPLIGLHRRHRPAEDERDAPDAEMLGAQAVLSGGAVSH